MMEPWDGFFLTVGKIAFVLLLLMAVWFVVGWLGKSTDEFADEEDTIERVPIPGHVACRVPIGEFGPLDVNSPSVRQRRARQLEARS
jgi:hypothetical protein